MKEHGTAITTIFYKNLLQKFPDLNNYFNLTHQKLGQQQKSLAHAVWAYAENIDNLGALKEVVEHIGQRHVSVDVKPVQYLAVGEQLLQAVKIRLGDAVNDELLEAWKIAYFQLAKIFIEYEVKLYQKNESVPHGWKGYKQFRVAEIKPESTEITSIHLEPVDDSAVPASNPGQYLTVRRFVESTGYMQPRQYTVSGNDGKTFRISVKREDAHDNVTAGMISTKMHALHVGEIVDVTQPCGEFVLNTKVATPVVMISGGVGQTPMQAMLSWILANQPNRQVIYLHSARHQRVHAFKQHMRDIVAKNKNVSFYVWYSQPQLNDVQGRDYHHAGHIDISYVRNEVILSGAEYYLCGPLPFMSNVQEQLKSHGVPSTCIHSEVFGNDSR